MTDCRERMRSGKSELVAPSELFAPDAKAAEVCARVVGGSPGTDVRTPSITFESVERILQFRPEAVVNYEIYEEPHIGRILNLTHDWLSGWSAAKRA